MKALVLFSGGIDSTTCLAMAVNLYGKENVICLSISYGQKHVKELEAAEKIIAYYGVESRELDLSSVFSVSDCSLLNHSTKEIPKETYDKQLKKSNGSPVSTYVPFRNGLFLASAASIALSYQCDVVYYGAHLDDAAGNAYPDCSEAFYEAIAQAMYEGSGHKIQVQAPFISWNKGQIIAKGLELCVPYDMTWSCYEGGEYPCGKCGTCLDRQRAFEMNHCIDPIFTERNITYANNDQ